VIFECVGGDLAGNIFDLMPAKSNMVVYGNFSKQKASYTQEEFHKKDKHIEAFLILFNWLTSLT
jgi:NADPH:quinone reductase-like Zn-dependent oxidoreductase